MQPRLSARARVGAPSGDGVMSDGLAFPKPKRAPKYSRREAAKLPSVKTCEVCGKEFRRHWNVGRFQFARRRVCESPACRGKLHSGDAAKRRAEHLAACARCGKLFPNRTRGSGYRVKHCSPTCHFAAQRDRLRETRLAAARPCLQCGVVVGTRRPRDAKRLQFCSLRCWYAWRRVHDQERASRDAAPRAQRTCVVCGASYLNTPRKKALKTCSKPCGYAYRKQMERVRLVCPSCGVTFTRHRCYARAKKTGLLFCSLRCNHDYHVGPNSPHWRGGKRTEEGYGPRWSRIAEAARQRDGYRCRRCGLAQAENGRRLDVDHIEPIRMFKTKVEANELENLASLCHRCHRWKTNVAERRWLKGDVVLFEEYRRSITGRLQ